MGLFYQFLRPSVCLYTLMLRQSFCLFTPHLRLFFFFTPQKTVHGRSKIVPASTSRRTTLSYPWSVGCAADKNILSITYLLRNKLAVGSLIRDRKSCSREKSTQLILLSCFLSKPSSYFFTPSFSPPTSASQLFFCLSIWWVFPSDKRKS